MVWLPTSDEGIDGNSLGSLRGEFRGDGRSGDDLDCEDSAREARGFRRVDMMAWLFYTEGATLSLVVRRRAVEDSTIQNVDAALCCQDVVTYVARWKNCGSTTI